jgi:hypothetical protein
MLRNRDVSLIFPLEQDPAFQTFFNVLLTRRWNTNGVLRLKRIKPMRSKEQAISVIVSDLYILQQAISPLSRISGVSISHDTSKTSHYIFTVRFSNSSIGHYELLDLGSDEEELNVEWSTRDGIIDYQSSQVHPFITASHRYPIKQELKPELHTVLTQNLIQALQQLLAYMKSHEQIEVRR